MLNGTERKNLVKVVSMNNASSSFTLVLNIKGHIKFSSDGTLVPLPIDTVPDIVCAIVNYTHPIGKSMGAEV